MKALALCALLTFFALPGFADDPQYLLPCGPTLSMHSVRQDSAYSAYHRIAKMLDVNITLGTAQDIAELKAVQLPLDLKNVSAADVLNYISREAHKQWKAVRLREDPSRPLRPSGVWIIVTNQPEK